MTMSFKAIMLGAAAALVHMPMAGAAEAKPGARGGKPIIMVAKSPVGERCSGVRRNWSRKRAATPVINRRIARQAQRIRNGRRMGWLTRFEALRVNGRLVAIRSALKVARFDGRVSGRERSPIQSMLDANSTRIARLARNDRRS
jgi:hypothetical protein